LYCEDPAYGSVGESGYFSVKENGERKGVLYSLTDAYCGREPQDAVPFDMVEYQESLSTSTFMANPELPRFDIIFVNTYAFREAASQYLAVGAAFRYMLKSSKFDASFNQYIPGMENEMRKMLAYYEHVSGAVVSLHRGEMSC
jgi:hypothetical protein